MNNCQRNSIQFDYFSDNFQRFEQDFYRYSTLNIPLTFLTDDILLAMTQSQSNFFRLNAVNARDHLDHYFFFRVVTPSVNTELRIYQYVYHRSQLMLDQEQQTAIHSPNDA